MRNHSRFIPGEEIDAVAQWRFGAMDAASILAQAQGEGPEPSEQAESLVSDLLASWLETRTPPDR